MDRYDAWRTGGDYHRTTLELTCPNCGLKRGVPAHTEYGGTWLDRDEDVICPDCGWNCDDDPTKENEDAEQDEEAAD